MFTIDELEAAANVAERLADDVERVVEEAKRELREPTGRLIRGTNPAYFAHGSAAMAERKFWQDVANRLRSIQLEAK